MAQTFTSDDVSHIARLAQIPVTEDEKKELSSGFNTVIKVLDTLNSIDVTNVEPTHQVTGLVNVFREDVVDEKRMFTQEEALENAPSAHDGYFMVDQVIDQES
jgi:aspartyl-tRNA(Asn)/glutamyl-tRNA(Gln) amidotransferase subunit C